MESKELTFYPHGIVDQEGGFSNPSSLCCELLKIDSLFLELNYIRCDVTMDGICYKSSNEIIWYNGEII